MTGSRNEGYHRNHYVPIWYQRRFLLTGMKEQKFHYLDLKPEYVKKGARRILRKDLMHWGPTRCFVKEDLYTTRFGSFESTDIEKYFFGKVDNTASAALDYFAEFDHEEFNDNHFNVLVPFMSLQKLRTPKGLEYLGERTGVQDRNAVLIKLQQLQLMFCALWAECIWSIADASESATKFIVSDHPVTVYNKGCFPGSRKCEGYGDPEIWQTGTHTIYPLDLNRCLILTNLSWVRNCYTSPLRDRPNPKLFRHTMFNFLQIQVGRKLSEREVIEINHVIKSRAHRYVAASEREWLYPERQMKGTRWDRLGDGFLFMPDPRDVNYTGEMVVGFKGGGGTSFDAYGRRPWEPNYDKDRVDESEWNALHAFKGEFARRFGPKRRGASFEFNRRTTEDSEEFHKHTVQSEGHYKALIRKGSKGKN